ncbi:lysophospholipid acyltransferase family protein [Halobacillus sp. K22]|uniref:lysophospholipid acyltransferase family protein n=1 Tax=Halobacillus sp. K22 TaxID=3457431 RepID=UPI003FCE656C
MLKAKKNSFIEWGFSRFNRFLLKSQFKRINISYSTLPEGPALFLINHSTWWDPLMIYHLNKEIIQSDGYGMMHEDGIRRFPFFRRIGAFSINTNDRRHLLQSLNYSKALLEQGRTVWIFPQGEEQHLEKRPLEFFTGVAYIAKKCPTVPVVPISIYYSFEHTKKPNVYIKVGEPLDRETYSSLNRKEMTRYFENLSTEQLDQLRETIIKEDHQSFRTM